MMQVNMLFGLVKDAPSNFDLVVNNVPVKIQFRQSSRCRRIIIKDVYPKGFEVIYPQFCSMEKAKSFFIKQYEWICHHSRQKPRISNFENGSMINLLGKELMIEFTGHPRGVVTIEESRLIIPGDEQNSKTKIKNFLKNLLLTSLKTFVDDFTKQLSKEYKEIKITDFSSKWGSCDSKSNLSFNLKLVFAPLPVMIYVLAHEVAHLCEMNHSQKFWDVVERLQPGFEIHRKWLKNNGAHLKKYIL